MVVMSSQDIIKSVSKKLKHYFEVRRLEDGFDLSGTDSPKLDHPPLKSRPTLLYDGLHDRPLKHYFHPHDVRAKLTHFSPPGNDRREKKVRRMVEKHMRKCHYVAPAVADVMYRNELRRQGKEVPPPKTSGFGIPLRPRRGKSTGGASYPVLRNAPPRYLSSGEAHRLVNMATKLLVATETIDLTLPLPKSKKHGRKQSSEEDTCVRKDENFVTYDINGRLIRLKKVEDDSAYVTPRESSPTSYSEDKIKPWLQRQLKRTEVPEGGHPTDNIWVRPHSAHPPVTLPPGGSPGTTRPKSALEENGRRDSGWMELQLHDDKSSCKSNSTVATQTGGELLKDYDPLERVLTEGDMTDYEVHVFTGSRLGASTRADVKLVLCGDMGRTDEIYLPDSTMHKVKFQKGQEDIFDLKCFFVGPLRKIIIGHDRKELGCGWFLESVVVKDKTRHIQHEVPCGRWLSARDSDCLTIREFPVSFSTTFRDLPEPEVAPLLEGGGEREREQRLAVAVEPAPSEATSHTSMRTQVSLKGRGEEEEEEEEEEDEGSDSSSSYSSDSSHNEAADIARKPPPVQEVEHKPLQRKDTFFDQPVSEHDYSSAIEALSQDRDRDGDVESDKPAYSARQRSASESSSSGSDTSDSESDTAVLSRKDIGDDGSPRDKNGKSEKISTTEKRSTSGTSAAGPTVGSTEQDRQLLRGPTIHHAARQGDLATIKRWVEHNAELINSKDERGWTVLHNAAAHGKMDVVQWLAVNLTDLDMETPTGYTAMHVSAQHGHTNCMVVLLAMGANLDCRSVEQHTPLHLASMGGYLNTVKWLVANQALLEAKDQMERTPLTIAEDYQHREVVDFLQMWMSETTHSPSQITATSLQWNTSQAEPVSRRKADRDNGNISDTDSSESLTDDDSDKLLKKKHDDELMEKKRLYEEQQSRMHTKHTSFLDSIRDEVDD